MKDADMELKRQGRILQDIVLNKQGNKNRSQHKTQALTMYNGWLLSKFKLSPTEKGVLTHFAHSEYYCKKSEATRLDGPVDLFRDFSRMQLKNGVPNLDDHSTVESESCKVMHQSLRSLVENLMQRYICGAQATHRSSDVINSLNPPCSNPIASKNPNRRNNSDKVVGVSERMG